jgi:hypothetical protein
LPHGLPRSGTTLFASFFWKKEGQPPVTLSISRFLSYLISLFLGGKPPNPQGRLRRGLGCPMVFREAEQRFLLLFLEKEGYHYFKNIRSSRLGKTLDITNKQGFLRLNCNGREADHRFGYSAENSGEVKKHIAKFIMV